MKDVRLGLIGAGNIGMRHARSVLDGKVNRTRLTAVCDASPERLATFGDDVATFTDAAEMIRSKTCNAVLIATPHYAHTTVGIDALEQGLHVLVEKPISVQKSDCEKLIAAHRKRRQVFAAMFNQRTDPHYVKLKSLIDDGHLGELMRVNWTITTWFRTDAYYGSGGWRATWAGEGGGVLLNQSPHQLDLLQWLCGMPTTVRAFCKLGKYHDIEVEDEVTAYLEYANGATGIFMTSTGEAPGTNRLELVGEHGKIIVEDEVIHFTRNEVSAITFSRESDDGFAKPDTWDITVPTGGKGPQHLGILNNFADAILDRKPLIAPAREGIHSVELANAMLLSSLTNKTIELPMNSGTYARRLKQLVRDSNPPAKKKTAKQSGPVDLSASF